MLDDSRVVAGSKE